MPRSGKATESGSPLPQVGSPLVRNIFCGHGRRPDDPGQRYRKKDGTAVIKSYARYLCSYNTQHPGECSGPASYGTAKLDSLVDQIIRLVV